MHVANKIAAGEVVERPASILKEVIENALDAGATQVDVDIAVGGRKLVSVCDNGYGMVRDDALLAVEQHATSKIHDVDDIETIDTLGFRGEALAAIASVSRFRLVSCAEGETTGTELLISGGTIRDVRDIGAPTGTTIEARDLFFNVPARRKFLRSQQTELTHIRSGFIVQALAHPDVGMTLTVDGKLTLELSGGGGLENRLADLFGAGYVGNLRAVRYESSGVRVSGYVGLPSAGRRDRTEQYIFVNGRATSAPLVSYAIREGYHTLLPHGRHPILVLKIELDPLQVDVNVHPTKREVRFRRPSEVRDAVIGAIRGALSTRSGDLSPGPDLPDILPTAPTLRPADVPSLQLKIEDLPPTRAFRYPKIPSAPVADGAVPASADATASPAQAPSAQESPEGTDETKAPWSWCRVLGQVGGLYVIMETEDGLVQMDPHAAHERVLFEQFMHDADEGEVPSQRLLMPESVELNPVDAERVRKHLEILTDMGFSISEFGGDAFVVDAVPAYFSGCSMSSLLSEVSHSLEVAGGRGRQGRWREESIAQASCKAAVKARDILNLEEIEKLVVDLARCRMPYTCPHGRPTLVFQSFHELHRKFGRE